MKKEVIIICGPTASGKSYLAHHLAKTYNGEIVNIDSMQVYKEIPIITASPSEVYKAEIPYHLYNFLPITEEFSVVKYLQLAAEKIRDISKRNKLIILVGGTGLYVNSLLFGYNQIPNISQDLRQHVRDILTKIGAAELWQQLKNLDPLAAAKIKPYDSQRLSRAYEVFLQTGKSICFFQTLPKELLLSEFNFKVIFLSPERTFLYKTCNERLEKIFKEGAITEIAAIKENFQNFTGSAIKAVGVSEILAYLNGDITLDKALILAQNKTKQYAKRQITWFKNQIKEKTTLEYSNKKEFSKLVFDIG